MGKILTKLKGLIPSKRKLIQLYSALLFNANIKGFFNGRIYQGTLKNICTPGLNCYSCPGASGACPLGSLQNALANSGKRTPYYIFGILLLYGILLGRMICGFLCPFGLIQELLYKIKTPKLKKNRVTKVLSFFKYFVLIFFVVLLPILYGLRNVPLPAFCKYICPAGTLEGALGLLANQVNESELSRLGPIFTWKFMLMVSAIVACIFIFRAFCRFVCPLGALYGLFNKISILGIRLDRSACVECGRCRTTCKMDISNVGDAECISCGDCIKVCPTNAISYKGGKILLPPNEIDTETLRATGVDDEEIARRFEENQKAIKRANVRTRVIKITSLILSLSLLVGALVYYNFIDTPTEDSVYEIGEFCPSYKAPIFDENGETGEYIDPSENTGKVTVVNFWGTQCGACIDELPEFDRIASEYRDSVTVIAVHKSSMTEYVDAPRFVADNYPESDMIFAVDTNVDGTDFLFTALGGKGTYPITIILDTEGRIVDAVFDTLTYRQLKGTIESILSEN